MLKENAWSLGSTELENIDVANVGEIQLNELAHSSTRLGSFDLDLIVANVKVRGPSRISSNLVH